jgi:DnaJ family protein C protein 11
MATNNDTNEEEDFSYYAILNVARDASDDDIKRAFRQLAQAYHPDKHIDATLQSFASENFTRLQEAYEVPLRPNKQEMMP